MAIIFASQAAEVTHRGLGVDVAVALDGPISADRQGELSARLSEVLGVVHRAWGELIVNATHPFLPNWP